MKRTEANRLREIANELDDHSYDIYYKDHRYTKEAEWFHWAATEIRKVIIDSGFNGIIDAKLKTKTKMEWELNKED